MASRTWQEGSIITTIRKTGLNASRCQEILSEASVERARVAMLWVAVIIQWISLQLLIIGVNKAVLLVSDLFTYNRRKMSWIPAQTKVASTIGKFVRL